MKKISIIGATVTGNRGAEAMLSTVIARIRERYPKSEFYVYSYFPAKDQELLSHREDIKVYSSTPLYLVFVMFPFALLFGLLRLFYLHKMFEWIFPSSVKTLLKSDVLIDIAGVSFMDGREIFLPFNILTILPAMFVGTPVVKMAQGMGPFKNIVTKVCAKLFLSKCKMIFARGEITYRHVDELFGHRQNYKRASDVAFLFNKGDSISVENNDYILKVVQELKKVKSEGKNIIGICPSSVVYQKLLKSNSDYVGLLANLIEEILKDDTNFILLFPNATREEAINKLRNNDLPIIKKVIDKLKNKNIDTTNILYIAKNINTDGIKSLVYLCNMTVVSRFHAMIASLSLGVPTIVLGWSHKYLEVMKEFDMDEFVYDYKTVNIHFKKNIDKILSNQRLYRNKIKYLLPTVKKESMKQFEYIFENVL